MNEVLLALQNNGADIVEVGIPYSDPIADGLIIQQSNSIALQNGMNIKKLFEQLQPVRPDFHLPLLLMGYLNPVLQYGMENFLRMKRSKGLSSITQVLMVKKDIPEI